MGFALWIDEETAWASGTHEYRPLGTAVVAKNGTFRHSDFHRYRNAPACLGPQYAGLFGSLEEVNVYLHSNARKRKPERLTKVLL